MPAQVGSKNAESFLSGWLREMLSSIYRWWRSLWAFSGSVWRRIFNELINFPTGFSSIINNVVETFFDTLKNIACLALRVFHLSLSFPPRRPPPPFTIKQCREQKSLALQSSKYLKAAQFLSLAWWIFKHRWYCGKAINIVKTNCLSHSSASLSLSLSLWSLFFLAGTFLISRPMINTEK